jgi:hypothetical protein
VSVPAAATSDGLDFGDALNGGQGVKFAHGRSTVPSAAGTAAQYVGSWRAYGNTNPITSSSSTWACSSTVDVETGIKAQTCAIRSRDGRSVQGAVIVRNNRSSLYTAQSEVRLLTHHADGGHIEGSWECQQSGVGANSWSVCFTLTLTRSEMAEANGWLNNKTWYRGSPRV